MCNNTLNEDDYKEAIKSKYEKEKGGIYSNYLNNPSQANLRDLCWKIFKSNEKTDDLSTYNDFFKFKFDSENEDTSISYTDKFKKVGRFFKGETKPAKIDTINFAAVLVDFELRPYAKFRKYYSEDKNYTKIEDDLMSIETVMESGVEISGKTENLDEDKKLEDLASSFTSTIKNNFFERLLKKTKSTIIVTTIIFCLIGGVIYFGLIKKSCMQWSGNHYEEVSCDLKVKEIGTYNFVEPLDERVINLRKIQVSDTTTFFKNNEAIIWYAKVGDSIDFFNTHGRHPENKKPLRPVTQYIVDKYVKIYKK